jgi:hypothetical protein|tara:strand:- start:261 stop:470 length:210 start_codon:yes stop_codon:yes gene_type:complete
MKFGICSILALAALSCYFLPASALGKFALSFDFRELLIKALLFMAFYCCWYLFFFWASLPLLAPGSDSS